MMRILFFSICIQLVANEVHEFNELHEFAGKHYIASFLDCDVNALSDLQGLMAAMDKAVFSCGATVLNKTYHVFPPDGLTAVYLLSESHASIHTYPEYGACFVDLFTCGEKPSAKIFDEVLRSYLRPAKVETRYFLRSQEIAELAYIPSGR